MNSKFFSYSDSIFQNFFSFSRICPKITEPYVLDMLRNEGCELTLDTTSMLNFIELEKLNYDEILEVRNKLGVYRCYMQLKTMVHDA